jgi:hypothetical protein
LDLSVVEEIANEHTNKQLFFTRWAVHMCSGKPIDEVASETGMDIVVLSSCCFELLERGDITRFGDGFELKEKRFKDEIN